MLRAWETNSAGIQMGNLMSQSIHLGSANNGEIMLVFDKCMEYISTVVQYSNFHGLMIKKMEKLNKTQVDLIPFCPKPSMVPKCQQWRWKTGKIALAADQKQSSHKLQGRLFWRPFPSSKLFSSLKKMTLQSWTLVDTKKYEVHEEESQGMLTTFQM